MRRILITTIALFALLLFSCGSKKQELGEYVYVDMMGITHCKTGCSGFYTVEGSKPATPIPIVRVNNIDHICSICFTEELYKQLLQQVEQNNNQLDE